MGVLVTYPTVGAIPVHVALSRDYVNPFAAVGSVICALTVVGGGDGDYNWSISNPKFQLSGTTGLTVNLLRSATGTFVPGGTEAITITADTFIDSFLLTIDTFPNDITLTPPPATIPQNAPAGYVICAGSTTGGRAPYTYTVDDSNYQFDSSGVMSRSATGSLSLGVDTFNVTSTDFWGNSRLEAHFVTVQDPASGVDLTTFTVENWNTSASSGFVQNGMVFPMGDVPSGQALQVELLAGAAVTAIQFDEIRRFPDGSLAKCVMNADLSSFTASQSKIFTVKSITGSFNNTSTKTLADVLGATDYKVVLTSMTKYTGTSGTAAFGSGSAVDSGTKTIRLNTGAAVPTRVWKYESGPVKDSYQVLCQAIDSVSGLADPHLEAFAFISLIKNPDGTTAGRQIWFRLMLCKNAVAGKGRYDYHASLQDGATVLETYLNLRHIYNATWRTARKDDDNNEAKRHWRAGTATIPTLNYKPNKTYWIASGYIPPYHRTFVPNLVSTATRFDPLDNMAYNTFVDQTGGSLQRGLLPNDAACAFMSQTAEQVRRHRCNSHCGAHINYHYLYEDLRQRPASAGCPGGDASPDIGMTIPALLLDPQATTNWTADGMPASFYASTNSGATAAYNHNHVTRTGGSLFWNFTGISDSHAANYLGFIGLLEGERDDMLLAVDLTTKAIVAQADSDSGYAGSQTPLTIYSHSDIHVSTFSIPATRYTSIAQLGYFANERHLGWTLNIMAWALGLMPDNDPQSNALKAIAYHNIDYFAAIYNYMSANQRTAGVLESANLQCWQHAIIGQGCFQMHGISRRTTNQYVPGMTIKQAGEFFSNASIGLSKSYQCAYAGHYSTLLDGTWHPTNNPFLIPELFGRNDVQSVAIEASTDLVIFHRGQQDFVAGDKLWPVQDGANVLFFDIPPELTPGTYYYLTQPATGYQQIDFDAGLGTAILDGQTVTGASGASGEAVIDTVYSSSTSTVNGYIVLKNITGTFVDNDLLRVGGVTRCTAKGAPQQVDAFKVSPNSNGSSPIAFSVNRAQANWASLQSDFYAHDPFVNPPYLPKPDLTSSMHVALVNMAAFWGYAPAVAAVDAANHKLLNVDWLNGNAGGSHVAWYLRYT